MKIKVDLNKNNIIAITIAIIIIVFVIILSNVGTPKTSKIYPTENEVATSKLKANNIYDKNTDISLATITSSKNDSSAILVKDSAIVTLRESSIKKYNGLISDKNKQEEIGLNSTIAVSYGSELKITDTSIETTTDYTNGIYVSGPKSFVQLIDSNINGFGLYSNGVVSSTSGNIEIEHSQITTKFKFSPTVVIKDSKGKVKLKNNVMLETNGSSSPLFRSAGTIIMSDSTGSANASRFAVLNGGNVTISNSTLISGGANDTEEEKPSGFLITGKGKETTLKLNKSSININDKMPYYNSAILMDIKDTKANILLDNSQLNFGSGKVLAISNSDVSLELNNQSLKGTIDIDDNSKLKIDVKNSMLEMSFNSLNTNKNISLNLDETTTLILTGNIYVKELNNKNKENSNIIYNNYNIFVAGTPIN